jgi:hypothetical protein
MLTPHTNRMAALRRQAVTAVTGHAETGRPALRLHDEAEAALRDVAYVLQLTRRVKETIVGGTAGR